MPENQKPTPIIPDYGTSKPPKRGTRPIFIYVYLAVGGLFLLVELVLGWLRRP